LARVRGYATLPHVSKLRFVQQQGFADAAASSCGVQYSGLMFQPRLVAVLLAIGIATQWAPLFFALALVLAWSALVPRLSPFDALYHVSIAGPRGLPAIGPAPPPRRFAQGMAASFALAIAVSLMRGATMLAWVLEGFLAAAVLALVVGRFCLGSYVYHVVTGNRAYAQKTSPWARSAED